MNFKLKLIFLFSFIFLLNNANSVEINQCKHKTEFNKIICSTKIHFKDLIFENFNEVKKTYSLNGEKIEKEYPAIQIKPSFLIYDTLDYCHQNYVVQIHPINNKKINFYALVGKNDVCKCGRINNFAKLMIPNFLSNPNECSVHCATNLQNVFNFEITRAEKNFDNFDINFCLKKIHYIPTEDFFIDNKYICSNNFKFYVDRYVLRVASNEDVFCKEIKNYLYGSTEFDPGGFLVIDGFENYTSISYKHFQSLVMVAMQY